MDVKNPELLLQEIPLYSLCTQRPPNEISVIECSDTTAENVNVQESGGGVTINLQGSSRTICWKTHENTLEIFEYSLDADLYSNNFSITFEGSKVLPGVLINTTDKNLLQIAFSTLHAVHYIVLDISAAIRAVPKPGIASQSLLSNLGNFDFENPNNNCYFHPQIQSNVDRWCGNIITPKGKSGPYLATALMTTQGNMVLVKMMENKPPVISTIGQASRMSRMFAGINPWADSGGPETISDFKLMELAGKWFVVAACMDQKIRIWEFGTHEMVLNHDFSSHLEIDDTDAKSCEFKLRICGELHIVSVYTPGSDPLFLQFVVKPDDDSNALFLDVFSMISASSVIQGSVYRHLVDYTLSSDHILTVLWRDVEENDSVTICSVEYGIWHDVAPHPTPAPEIPLLPYRDVRESYMDYIFTPGRFSPVALSRTLSIHRRFGSQAWAGMQELKERVGAHIQNEIQGLSSEENADDNSLQLTVWGSFYQNLIQYQQVVSHSLGLTTGPSGSLISVIKTGFISVLSPVSQLEAVCRGSGISVFKASPQFQDCSDQNLEDLAKLLECLGLLHGYLGIEFLDSIQQNLCLSGNNANDVISDLLPDVLEAVQESTGNNELGSLFDGIADFETAVRMLLACLEPVDSGTDFDIPNIQSWPAGTQGVELLSRCTVRHIENRFQLSILLHILSSIAETTQRQYASRGEGLGVNQRSTVVKFIKSYQALYWISTTITQNISQAALENTMRTLSVHDSSYSAFNDDRSKSLKPAQGQTVLEFFVSTEGGKLLQAFLKPQGLKKHNLLLKTDVVTQAVNFLVYLMWPSGPTLTLPDFLLGTGHYTILQRYLHRELKPWCSWCPKSREYMLAHCHLHHRNLDQAVRSFIFASSGISTEEYLITKLLREEEDNLHQVAQEIIYFTKVLPMFERLDLKEEVVTLAEHAIEVTKMHEHDPNLPILWSSVFRQNNSLSRYTDALRAIVLNPDPDHRKDCLRTLAVSLCENKKYKILVEFQYGELEDDLVNILEHRARGTDLATATHNYYDLLFAFHVERRNFRKAASAMYEQAYRTGCEFTPASTEANIECLQKQVHCYETCISFLNLVAEENRWILHPVGSRTGVMSQKGYASPKRQSNGDVVQKQPQAKVIVHELKDIKKELLLVEMKLKLEKVGSETKSLSLGPLVSANEISAFLCHVGCYDDAIKLCEGYDIPLTSMFESLASKCVRLSYADDKGQVAAWEWLWENETAKTHCAGGSGTSITWTAADAAYRLLEVYLEKYGEPKSLGSRYYYATAKALMGLSAALPAWFVKAYKDRNSPELLRLLVCFDRLDEATEMAVGMIDSECGKLGTVFNPDTGKRQSSWLPFTIIEQLRCILEDQIMENNYEDLYRSLDNSLHGYLDIAETISSDMVQAAHQQAAIAMQR